MENREQLVANLVQALSATINPNNEIRKQAETFVKWAERQPGYVSSLLQISAEPSVSTRKDHDSL